MFSVLPKTNSHELALETFDPSFFFDDLDFSLGAADAADTELGLWLAAKCTAFFRMSSASSMAVGVAVAVVAVGSGGGSMERMAPLTSLYGGGDCCSGSKWGSHESVPWGGGGGGAGVEAGKGGGGEREDGSFF